MCLLAKEVGCKRPPGFESLRLRRLIEEDWMRWAREQLLALEPELKSSDHEPSLSRRATMRSILEDWMSGLNQRFTKPPAGKTAREFESHLLRNENNFIFYCSSELEG